jgi:hypothetical protein
MADAAWELNEDNSSIRFISLREESALNVGTALKEEMMQDLSNKPLSYQRTFHHRITSPADYKNLTGTTRFPVSASPFLVYLSIPYCF